MKLSKRWLYGSMGFLSLLGLIGIFTEERGFLAFFASPWTSSFSSSPPTRWWTRT